MLACVGHVIFPFRRSGRRQRGRRYLASTPVRRKLNSPPARDQIVNDYLKTGKLSYNQLSYNQLFYNQLFYNQQRSTPKQPGFRRLTEGQDDKIFPQ
jgi:hypothetical protein